MKEIKAIIRPEMFDTVYRKIKATGHNGVTVYHGEGTGRHGDPEKMNASLDFPILHSKVIKMIILVSEEDEENLMNIIQQAACTNHVGDGIIYSTTIGNAMSIRTGAKGEAAF